MLDQPGSADRQVFSNLPRRTSAEGTTDGDRDAYEHSDSTCEQLQVRHVNAGICKGRSNLVCISGPTGVITVAEQTTHRPIARR
jgi:hypothetical protein